MLFYGFSKVPACTDPAGFYTFVPLTARPWGEVQILVLLKLVVEMVWFAVCFFFFFNFISVERGCHPDCSVLGRISESDSKLNSDG